MLSKKTLAVALMGLGLVSGAYAAEYQDFTVKFTATVKAGTCPFVVEGGDTTGDNEITVRFGDVRKGAETTPKALTFRLNNCSDAIFDTVVVQGDNDEDTLVTDTTNKGVFAFYTDVGATTSWNAKSQGLTFTNPQPGKVLGSTQFSEVKYVRFEQTSATQLGDQSATVIFTAKYD